MQGHGGSGPTRLRPRPGTGRADDQAGMREPGDSVPPELLPEVSAEIRVVCVGDEELVEPPGVLAPGLGVAPSALPRLQATADGGLVVGYRVHRQLPLMTYYWEAAAQVLDASGWRPPITFTGTDATLEEVSLAAGEHGVVVATQSDGRLDRALHWTEGFGGRECPYLADHHGAVIWHGVHGAGQVVLATVETAGPVPPDDAPGSRRSAQLRSDARREVRSWVPEAAGGRGERHQVQAAGETYHLYWGDLHRHSLVSRCTSGDEPSLEDFYRYAWDVDEYDFWAVTDHAENSTAYQWWSIQKIADLLHVPGRFVPFYGFEWTSAEHGHQNVIYGDVARGAPIFSAFAEGSTTPDGLWRGLAEHPEFPAITIPHHPGSAMVHNDWDYHDPRFSRLVEVFQACRGNYESEVCFRPYSDGTATGTFMIDGLRRGHRFGLIASSDHGHGASYVAVLARSLSRADVFEALQSRRTCAASTRDVFVDLRLGPHLMGSDVEWTGPRPLRVHASGYAELARVDILRDGEVVHVIRGEPDLPPGHRRVDLRVEWGKAETTTRWDGRLTVDGGRLVLPDHVGPEVTEMDEHTLAWQHVTHSFGEHLRVPAGRRRGERVRARRRGGRRSSARAGPSGSGWPSWPNGWPPVRSCPTGGARGRGPASCRCSRPSVPCSVSACARSTSTSGTRRPLRPSTTPGCSRWTASWRGRRRSGSGRRPRRPLIGPAEHEQRDVVGLVLPEVGEQVVAQVLGRQVQRRPDPQAFHRGVDVDGAVFDEAVGEQHDGAHPVEPGGRLGRVRQADAQHRPHGRDVRGAVRPDDQRRQVPGVGDVEVPRSRSSSSRHNVAYSWW